MYEEVLNKIILIIAIFKDILYNVTVGLKSAVNFLPKEVLFYEKSC